MGCCRKFAVFAGAGFSLFLSGCGGGLDAPNFFAGQPAGKEGVSPKGSVVFTANGDGNWEIYTQGATDPQPRRLTRVPQEEEGAVPSPDGERLAFVSRRDGDYEIYVMNRDGSEQTRLTRSKGVDEGPQWTPDGRKIVFESAREGNWDVFTMNADGSNPVNLSRTPYDEADPILSPDGKKILFKAHRDGKWHLQVMNLDGSNLSPLARSAYTEGVLDDPAWSPDGTQIAFVSRRVFKTDIYIMDLSAPMGKFRAGKETIRNLTRHSARDEGPTWSPDGRSVAFVSDREGPRNLFVTDVETGDTRKIGPMPVVAGPGRWSPDGRWLIYVGGNAGDQRIQLVSADGRWIRDMGWKRGEMTELQWFPGESASRERDREIMQ